MSQSLTILRSLEAAAHRPIEMPLHADRTTSVPLALAFARRVPCVPLSLAKATQSGGEVTSNDGSSTYDPIDDD